MVKGVGQTRGWPRHTNGVCICRADEDLCEFGIGLNRLSVSACYPIELEILTYRLVVKPIKFPLYNIRCDPRNHVGPALRGAVWFACLQ